MHSWRQGTSLRDLWRNREEISKCAGHGQDRRRTGGQRAQRELRAVPELATPCANLARKRRARSAKTPSCAGDIGALFSPWEAARGIVLGVSGGPDRAALMLLAAERAWRAPRRPRFMSRPLTMDREDSRCEAEMVARWAAGLRCRTPFWSGAASSQIESIQERAREARYELLFEYAARIGAYYVMTAHHADDQAETICSGCCAAAAFGALRHGKFERTQWADRWRGRCWPMPRRTSPPYARLRVHFF